jgi:SagB-type dehydrogenase family enzyme
VVAGNVIGLRAGIYKYGPQGHELEKVAGGDVRAELCAAALDQECVEDGAAVLVFAAVYERTARKYGEGGVQYVHMEVGHAARNVYLQAVSLGLGTVIVGAFDDGEVERLLKMQDDKRALCIMPVGRV